jgi:hypothetical protein
LTSQEEDLGPFSIRRMCKFALAWRSAFCLIVASMLAVGTTSQVSAGDTPKTMQVAKGLSLPNFKARGSRGAPKVRVGGGTRSGGESHSVTVLAPERVGLTASDQPVLHWFTPMPLNRAVEIVVILATAMDPLLELVIESGSPDLVQSIDLAEHGIRLDPGVEYEWSVSVVVDPTQRSLDSMSGAVVMYDPPSNALAEHFNASGQLERAGLLAENGYWHDSFAIYHQVAKNDTDARAGRNAILEQVGLTDVAAKLENK